MTLTPAFLDELRARTSLSALIGKTTKLQRAGREMRGCCPFHNEKTPSFYVNDDKGFYHCFGCSVHGDAIRWMTDSQGLHFIDAVKELAQAAGLEMPAMDPRAAEKQEQSKGLHEAMQAAADWFQQQLGGLDGGEAQALLRKRGIDEHTRRAFGIGYAPDARGKLRTALREHGDALLVEAGLLIQVEGKEPYDRFRGRLMIPIKDSRGRVIAFGGRVIGEGEPKYLNSPDTPLFDKGRTLYNLDRAAPAARKTARVIVVEGYMDTIALARAGIDEAVAPLGTALTEAQLERLWRMVDVPLLCFDGDAAGQKAALRAAHRALPLLQTGKTLRFVDLPSGQDPDDVVREGGAAAFDQLLVSTVPLEERLWMSELAQTDVNTPDGRASLKKRIEALSGQIRDSDLRNQYSRSMLKRFFELFGLRRQEGGADRLQRLHNAVAEANRNPRREVIYTLRRSILLGLMRHPSVIAQRYEDLTRLGFNDSYLESWKDNLLRIAERYDILSESLVDEIMATTDVAPIDKRDYQRDLAFTFYRLSSEAVTACADLNRVIEIMIEEQEVNDAIATAHAVFKRDVTAENFAAQNRAHREKAAVDLKLSDWLELAAEAA